MHRILIFIFLLLLIASCKSEIKQEVKVQKQTEKETEPKKDNSKKKHNENYINGIPKSVKQDLFGTLIKLSKLSDPYEYHLYGKIEFYSENKKIFEHQEKYLEVEGYQDNICKTFQIKENGEFSTFYVFKNNQRPEPEKYLIFKKVNDKIIYIGKTETLTGEIYGDVDLDGKFEIGGYNQYCQVGSDDGVQFDNPMFCFENIRVYEISNNIKRDVILENSIKSN